MTTDFVIDVPALQAQLPNRLMRIADEIRAAGGTGYLVGGWVRDALLGCPSRDYDIEVYGIEQEALLEILRHHGKPNLVGKSYGVINLIAKGNHFDFSFPRLESKVGVGHRAFAVETRSDLDFYTAALRRDFTINAMGMELPSLTLIDPHGGQQDLQRKLLRHVGPAFAEDSLRVLRGVQFAARFECTVAPETVAMCRTLDLCELSKERLYEEFRKWLLKSQHPSYGLTAFCEMQLDRFFPWLHSQELSGAFLDEAASLRSGDELEQAVLMFGVLTQACPTQIDVQAFLEHLTNEIRILRQVPALWREAPVLLAALDNGFAHQAPWLRRFALRVSLPAACRWVRAFLQSEKRDTAQLSAVVSFAHTLDIWDKPPEPLLTGKMLLGMDLKPGRFFGEWIAESFELQLDGVLTSEEDVREWAIQRIKRCISR